jgi:hypothetical protein
MRTFYEISLNLREKIQKIFFWRGVVPACLIAKKRLRCEGIPLHSAAKMADEDIIEARRESSEIAVIGATMKQQGMEATVESSTFATPLCIDLHPEIPLV